MSRKIIINILSIYNNIYLYKKMNFDYLNFSLGYLLGGVTVYYSKNIMFYLIKSYLHTKDYIKTMTKNTKPTMNGNEKIKLNETLVNTLRELRKKYEHIPEELCNHEITASKYIKHGNKIVFFSKSQLKLETPNYLIAACMLKHPGSNNFIDITGIINNIILHDNCFIFSDEFYHWINKFIDDDKTVNNDIIIEYLSDDYNLEILTKDNMLYLDKNNNTITKIVF